MDISVALTSAVNSLLAVQQEMNVASNNIANASTTGYTEETVQTAAAYTDGVGTGISVTGVTSTVNQYLAAQIVSATSASNAADTFETYYDSLQEALGTVSSDTSSSTGGSDISSYLSTLQSDLTTLSDSPDSTADKTQVVEDLETLTAGMRSLSSQIQTYRQQADAEISTTVDDINTQLGTISNLNSAITAAKAAGQSVADLEDQRTVALQSLASDIGINYFVDGNDQVQIYTSSGQPLLTGNQPADLSHTAAAAMSSSATYPGSIDGITVDGTDITDSITSGTLSALIQMRDDVLPNVQSEFDNLSSSLSTTLNGIYAQGTTSPPPQTLTGTTDVAGDDAVTIASGTTVRIAVTDSSGDFSGYTDVDLTGDATVNDVINTINADLSGAGVDATASLNGDGNLVISANSSNEGVAISTIGGSVGGTNFSAYFGINALLVNGASAATVSVNPSLIASSDDLATGTLNDPTTSTVAVASGDGTIATQLADALTGTQNFSASGFQGATTATFSDYAADLIADVSTRYQSAKGNATTADSMLSQLQTSFADQSGVNVDQETAKITTLQNLYDASAQVIATVKTMFQSLLTAVQ